MATALQSGADRTQFLVVAFSLAVLGLALAAGNLIVVDQALDELRNLDRLQYSKLADFAERSYNPRSFLSYELQRHQGFQIGADFEARGVVIRNWPEPSAPLREYASFIEGSPPVKVVSPTHGLDTAKVIEWARQHPNPEHRVLVLNRVQLRCYTERPDGRQDEVRGTERQPAIVDPLRSSCLSIEWIWSLGSSGFTIANPITPPVVIADCCSSPYFGDPTAVRRWLAALGSPYSELYSVRQQTALPRLHELWAEVGSLTIETAAQYLRQRQDSSQALKLQGVTLTTSASALAPFVTAMLLLLLTVQIADLKDPTLVTLPSPLVLRPGVDADILNLVTVVLAPAGANLLLLSRVTWNGPQRWMALTGFILLVVVQSRLVWTVWVSRRERRQKHRWRVS